MWSVIDRNAPAATPDEELSLAGNPDLLARPTTTYLQDLGRGGDAWTLSPRPGEVAVRYITDAALGVLEVSTESGGGAAAPATRASVGDSARHVFTQFRPE